MPTDGQVKAVRTATWEIVAFALGDQDHMPACGVKFTVVARRYSDAKSKGYKVLQDKGYDQMDITSCLRSDTGLIYN